MRGIATGSAVYALVRVTLAVLFLWAGALKLAHPEHFAVTVEAFGILPGALIRPAARVLPVVEVLAALGLLCDVRGSLAVVTGLLVVFIAVILHALRLGLDIDCGCYGPGEPQAEAFGSLRTSLHRDLSMLGGALFLYGWRHFTRRRPRGAVELWQLAYNIFNYKEKSTCAR